MATKRFRCFSGPNGSVKSTLINEINKNFDLGVTVNADEIESNLNSKRFLYLGDFLEVDINQNDWSKFLATYKKVDKRIDGSNMSSLTVRDTL